MPNSFILVSSIFHYTYFSNHCHLTYVHTLNFDCKIMVLKIKIKIYKSKVCISAKKGYSSGREIYIFKRKANLCENRHPYALL